MVRYASSDVATHHKRRHMFLCHSCEGRNPEPRKIIYSKGNIEVFWIPAFAGMTIEKKEESHDSSFWFINRGDIRYIFIVYSIDGAY